MPFESKAQRREFYYLKSKGKMSQAEIDKWERATKGKSLPEYAKHSKSSRKHHKKSKKK